MTFERLARQSDELVTAGPTATAADLAGLMERHGVGSVGIEEHDRVNSPLWIVTDRALAIQIGGGGRDARTTPARNIMSTALVTADISEGIGAVCRRMSEHESGS